MDKDPNEAYPPAAYVCSVAGIPITFAEAVEIWGEQGARELLHMKDAEETRETDDG